MSHNDMIVPVSVGTKAPVWNSKLPWPTNVVATLSNSKTLTVACTVEVPFDAANIAVFQFYEKKEDTLVYTVTYHCDLEHDQSEQKFLDLEWTALVEKGIDLPSIKQVGVYLHQDDPKTSRGTYTTVGNSPIGE